MNRMDDLISRQAAIDAIGEVHPLDYNAQAIKTRIESLPSAQPQTAHWIIDGHHIQCSKCGETMCNTDREGDPISRNFCPSCGAKMRGTDEHQT